MKNQFTKNQFTAVFLGLCLLTPMAYAESEMDDLVSIEQVGDFYLNTPPHASTEMNDVDSNNAVLIMQLGDDNSATVDVKGNDNQLGLTQNGNKNTGDIQVNGDGNAVSALQNGNELSFGLKIEGDNKNYTLTQEKL